MTTIAPLPSHRFDRSLLGAGPLRGRVATVFTHAAIARLEPGGSLLTLLHPSRELVPFGVAIPWDQAPLTMGDAVRLTDRALLIGSAQLVLEGEGTALGLVATPFSLEILKVHLPISMSFARRGRPDIEKRALQRADNSLRQVVLALSSGLSSPADLTGAIDGLVGTGFGSTPTGDDWLVGVAAAGHRLASSGHTFRPAWEAFRAALAAVSADATTPVSREMLRHAARGEFPEALLHFARLLGHPTARAFELRESCRKLVAIGSQTGGDLLTGALSLASSVRSQRGGIA